MPPKGGMQWWVKKPALRRRFFIGVMQQLHGVIPAGHYA
jgi:hypothetical protein